MRIEYIKPDKGVRYFLLINKKRRTNIIGPPKPISLAMIILLNPGLKYDYYALLPHGGLN